MTASAMTVEEVERGLVSKGVPRAQAHAEALRQAGMTPAPLEQAPAVVDLRPVTLRLPWSVLISDNDKFVAFLRSGKPSMKIRREYTDAKERIANLARDAMEGRTALACPLRFEARVWYPSAHPRDLTNWAKLVQDALSGVVYQDDRWLHDVRWLRIGVDVDSPCAVLTITPHAASPK